MTSMLSYACGTSSEPLIGLTIGDMFDQTVLKYPDDLALISRHQDLRYTYGHLKEQVDQCAKAFIATGHQKGDRVGIWSPNCAEWLITQIATAKIGIILVNINPSYRESELEYALNQSGCRTIIIADTFKSSDYAGMITALAPEVSASEGQEFLSERLIELTRIISIADKAPKGILQWNDFLQLGDEINPSQLDKCQAALEFDDPINIQYTSGTTGYPKGATLSHHNILNNGYLVTKMQRFSHLDKLVIPVPLYHCFGMVMGNLGCITHGAAIIYASAGFDPQKVLEAISEEAATAVYGVPTMFYAMLQLPDFDQYDMTTLRTGVMAGSLCPSELMRRVNNDMNIGEMEIAYGMTETSPVSTQTRHDAPFDKRVSTVGTIMPHTEIKIIDTTSGKVVPRGDKGELCTRGYCVMLGYWNDAEKTAESIDQARWMHTGDLATMDDEGYISIVGRIKDMIIRGGENIYPKEIEEFLSKHPSIETVQVIGVPDDKYGEQLCAWIQTSDGLGITPDQIQKYCKGKIAHYKIPHYYRFVNDFPMTVTGKIRKVEMRRITIEELESNEEA